MSGAKQGTQFHLGCKTPSGEEAEGAEGKEAGLRTEVEGWCQEPGGWHRGVSRPRNNRTAGL